MCSTAAREQGLTALIKSQLLKGIFYSFFFFIFTDLI